MPAFSTAIASFVGPRSSTWSRPIEVTAESIAGATFVASKRPPRPTSRMPSSTFRDAKIQNAAAVATSK
jgi:hypothetical protein